MPSPIDAAASPIAPSAAPPPDPPRKPRFFEGLFVFLLGAALMSWTYGGLVRSDGGVPGNDSFYHIKMSAMMPQAVSLRQFPWLQFCYFTGEGDDFVSHHYGFHVLLAPFVQLSHYLTGSYLPGARWGIASFFGLLMLVLHRLIAHTNVPWRWIWLPLFVLLPFQFFTRHAFIRAISPSLTLMLLTLLLAFRRRYLLMALTIIAYVHLYMGGVLFAPVMIAAFVSSLLFCKERTAAIKVASWSLGAWMLAIALHPYRAGMWDFLHLQVFGSGLSPDIAVGKEWRPYNDVWWFTRMCGVMLGAWIVALVLRLRANFCTENPPRRCADHPFLAQSAAQELALLLLNAAFFVLTAKARRFIEYWPAFCLLSIVYLARPFVERATLPSVRTIGAFLSRQSALLCLGFSVLLVAFTPQWRGIRRDAKTGYNLPAIEAAMNFIRQRSQPGEIIFTDDWDIFPVFFYYNAHNYYVVGLDPKFTHARRPDLWARYVKLTRGQSPAEQTVLMPDGQSVRVSTRLTDIRDHFHASWVVTDRDHQPLAAQLAADSGLAELVYPATRYAEAHAEPYLVFRIHDSAPPQPAEPSN